MDRIKIGVREIKYDRKNTILALVVEISLATVIMILLTFTLQLDVIVDVYFQREMPSSYSINIKNISYTQLKSLQKDGIKDIEIYSEKMNTGSFFYLNSEKDFEYVIINDLDTAINERIIEGENVGVTQNKNNSFCSVWISKAIQDKYKINMGNEFTFRYNSGENMKCKVSGVIDEKESFQVYILFTELEKFKGKEKQEDFIFQANGTLDSIVGYEFRQLKWKIQGIKVIAADLKEVTSVIFLIKAIFLGLSIIGTVLCVISLANIYGMKLHIRTNFIYILSEIGMQERIIQKIYQNIFYIINIISVIIAYIIARISLEYINALMEDTLAVNMEWKQINIIALVIVGIMTILIKILFKRYWYLKRVTGGI